MMRTVSQVECNSKDASVVWEPRGDNRAPILTYKIQYNTTFLSDTWETAAGEIKTQFISLKLLVPPAQLALMSQRSRLTSLLVLA